MKAKQWVLGLASVFLSVSGCSTTKVSTTVTRAPWISVKGLDAVSLDIQDHGCVDVVRGPEMVVEEKGIQVGEAAEVSGVTAASVQIGIALRTKVPKEDVSTCGDSSPLSILRDSITQGVTRKLQGRGVTVTQGDTGKAIKVDLGVRKVKKV